MGSISLGATWPAWPTGAAWPTWRSYLHFLGAAAVEAAFPLLEALTKAGQDHLAKAGQDGREQPRKGENQAMEEQVPAQEKEAEEKEKKDVEPEKEKEIETQDSDFEVIPEVSE